MYEQLDNQDNQYVNIFGTAQTVGTLEFEGIDYLRSVGEFRKVPVIGYKYETVSNKYLAQKYTDVLFLFNDHLTDYKGTDGNAEIKIFIKWHLEYH